MVTPDNTVKLRKHGLRTRLAGQPFDVLAGLLENAGKVVRRQQLQKKLWPEGVCLNFEHGLNKAISQLRQALGEVTHSPRFIETLPCVGYRFVAPIQQATRPDAPGPVASNGNKRLGVLPFEDFNRDPEWEYFTDGLMAELITHLGRVLPHKLEVIGRNSTMSYKASVKSLDQIGEELRLDYLVTGSVRRDSGRIRVSVELIQVRDERCVWAESYERQLADLFSLENDLSVGIADAIATQLRVRDLTGLVRTARLAPEIHEAYLKGRYHYNKRTVEGLSKSISYFKQAVERDPSFAFAYAGLAESYVALESWGELCGSEAFPLIRSAVKKALDLEPGLAEAHAILAWVMFAYERDWADSDRESQLAIRLNPNCVPAYHNYAFSLLPRGHFNQALEANYRAHELDPLSLHVNSLRGWLLFCAGRPDEAIEQCHQAINFEPHYPPSHAWLSIALAAKGNFDEAIAESDVAMNSSGRLPMFIACSGYCYAASGEAAGAERVLNELAEISNERYVSPYWVAVIYAALKRRDKTFAWLERAHDDHSGWAPFLNVDPRLDSLHQDPRFASLVRRLGLMQQDAGYNHVYGGAVGDTYTSMRNQ